MNLFFLVRGGSKFVAFAVLLFCLSCAAPKVNWNTRVGHYTYEQAVVELGPPEKSETLSSGRRVAEWLVRKGYTSIPSPYSVQYPTAQPYPYPVYAFRSYGPPYAGYWIPTHVPDQWLRLVFGTDGELSEWKRIDK